jgi:hypothetical protein
MRKLRLDVASLNVQTFESVDNAAAVPETFGGGALSADTTTGPWICLYECPCDTHDGPPFSC